LSDEGYTGVDQEHHRIVDEAIQQMADLSFLNPAETTFDSSSEEDLPWVE
jgi:hypothetical protein